VATSDELVAEALKRPVLGLGLLLPGDAVGRGEAALELPGRGCPRAAAADAMLGMGTGGGERLARLSPRPRRTAATEAWPPNVSVAAVRLRSLGHPGDPDEGAPDNTTQTGNGRGRLPFRDGAFTLVTSRHEAFRAAEVSRSGSGRHVRHTAG